MFANVLNRRKSVTTPELLMAAVHLRLVNATLPAATNRTIDFVRAGALGDPSIAAATGEPPTGLHAVLYEVGTRFGATLLETLMKARPSFVTWADQCDRPVHVELFVDRAVALALPEVQAALDLLMSALADKLATPDEQPVPAL